MPLPVLLFSIFNVITVFVTGVSDQILLECIQTEVPPAERGPVFGATNFFCCSYLVVYGVISLLLPNQNLIYVLLFLSVLLADLWVLVLAFSVRRQVNKGKVTAQKAELEGLMNSQNDSD